MKFSYILCSFCFFLCSSFLFAQEPNIRISIDTLSSKSDAQALQFREIMKKGYKEVAAGKWINEKGEEIFIPLPAIPQPANGVVIFQKKLGEKLLSASFTSTKGSIIFTVSNSGKAHSFYMSDDGDRKLQQLLRDFVVNESLWSPGIQSGPMSSIILCLSVIIE